MITCIAWLSLTCAVQIQEPNIDPILMLPGLTGTMLEVRKGDDSWSHCLGYLPNKYEIVWVNLSFLSRISCFIEIMGLQIGKNASSYAPSYVDMRPNQDGMYATSYMDPYNFLTREKTINFANIFQYFLNAGHIKQVTLDAVPYDWRESPYNFYEPGEYFSRIKGRVEKMYNMTGGKRITLVGHSMGGATGALFLSSYVPTNWKQKYIKQFVSVAGVYGGSMKSLALITTGFSSGYDYFSGLLESIFDKLPSVHSLIPIANSGTYALWGNETLVSIGDDQYTTDMIPQLYSDLGLDSYVSVIDKLRGVGYENPPGVRTYCLYTTSIETISSIHIKNKTEHLRPTFGMGWGDGTVPARSLEGCSAWDGQQEAYVGTKIFNSDHMDMVASDKGVWDFILDVSRN